MLTCKKMSLKKQKKNNPKIAIPTKKYYVFTLSKIRETAVNTKYWKGEDSHTLLERVKMARVLLKVFGISVSYKVKPIHTIWPSNAFPKSHPR